MNREIKFRAYNHVANTMYYDDKSGDVFKWQNEGQVQSIMQFTGLKDKNGKEIYEGDQLYICSGYSSIVEFKDGMFVSVYKHPEDGEIIPLTDAIGKETIVIGNIYE